MKLCVLKYQKLADTETFIRAHGGLFPGTLIVHGWPPRLLCGDRDVVLGKESYLERRLRRAIARITKGSRRTTLYRRILRDLEVDVVLAEFGISGVHVMEACGSAGVPLVVHFHGYEISRRDLIDRYRGSYKEMFGTAASIICVSREMREVLLSLGAPADKLIVNPCGVDIRALPRALPSAAPPVFLFAGRFVEKKAPHLLIQALAHVKEEGGAAKLWMIGDGKLRGRCEETVARLNLTEDVAFLGSLPHERVLQLMGTVRAYVQHSVTAPSGDKEGAPVSIMEAGGAGLPVVATEHAGIVDVVEHGVTGYLVEEGDVNAMAAFMLQLERDPGLADRFGAAGRKRVHERFSTDHTHNVLRSIINAVTVPNPA